MLDNQFIEFTIDSLSSPQNNVGQVQLLGNISSGTDLELITIRNALLMEAYQKQSNVLHLIIDGNTPRICQFYKTTRTYSSRL